MHITKVYRLYEERADLKTGVHHPVTVVVVVVVVAAASAATITTNTTTYDFCVVINFSEATPD